MLLNRSNALDFHHLFGKKGSSISKLATVPRVKIEIGRYPVVVLCANCHRELHNGFLDENSLISRRIKLNKPQMYLFPVKRVVK